MKYVKLLLKKAFNPIGTIIGVITALSSILADAFWGEQANIQIIACWVLHIILGIIALQVCFIAPYKLWAEDQAKLVDLAKSNSDLLSSERKRLLDASSDLFTSVKTIYLEWQTSEQQQRENLRLDFQEKCTEMSNLADKFLHEERIYRAAQDAISNCRNLFEDTKNRERNNESYKDASDSTKALRNLLTSSNNE